MPIWRELVEQRSLIDLPMSRHSCELDRLNRCVATAALFNKIGFAGSRRVTATSVAGIAVPASNRQAQSQKPQAFDQTMFKIFL